MRKIGRSRVEEQTAAKQWHLPLGRMAEESLWDAMVLSGAEFALEQLEAERAGSCGLRYAHLEERAAMRAGHGEELAKLGRAEERRARAPAGAQHR